MRHIIKRVLLLAFVLLLCLTSVAQAGYMTGTALGGTTKKTKPTCKHNWELVSVTREATCKKEGRAKYRCTKCHKVETHKVAKLAHSYSGWVVTQNPGDHTAGRHTRVCSVCGHKETAAFYMSGALYLDMEATAEEQELIEALQSVLKELGFYTGKVTGVYDKATAAAMRKYQKKYGMKADGVAWPETLVLLAVGQPEHTPVYVPTEDARLALKLEMLSEPKEAYHAGDVIEWQWTLTNLSKKNVAVDSAIYLFYGTTPKSRTDVQVTDIEYFVPDETDPSQMMAVPGMPEAIAKGEEATGVLRYTVTNNDTAAGSFSVGYVARARLGKKEYRSNHLLIKNLKAE